MSLLGRLKELLFPEPSLELRAAGKCRIKGDDAIMTQFLMFHMSHTYVGTKLTLTEEDLPFLDEVVNGAADLFDDSPNDLKTTYDGAAVYFGTLVVWNLGGKWIRAGEGRYRIDGVGTGNASVDPFEIVRSVVNSTEGDTLAAAYAEIKAKAA